MPASHPLPLDSSRTQFVQRLQQDSAFSSTIEARTPAGRWGTPRDMAGPAVFLCSEAAAYVNGACLTADGGMIETFEYGDDPFGAAGRRR